MDIKKAAIYTGAFVGSFLVMLMGAYFLFPLLNADKVEEMEREMAEVSSGQAESEINSAATVAEAFEDSLKNIETDSVLVLKQQHRRQVDSLYAVIEQMKAEFEEKLSARNEKVINKEIEDATKTLLNLDEEQLAPIANTLDDSQLLKLYRSATNIQRQKLLGSLEPQKASKILKQVIL